jgi:hypothetical protein
MMFEANKVDRDGSVDRKDFLSILNKQPSQWLIKQLTNCV